MAGNAADDRPDCRQDATEMRMYRKRKLLSGHWLQIPTESLSATDAACGIVLRVAWLADQRLRLRGSALAGTWRSV
jgi:hypothetical protein